MTDISYSSPKTIDEAVSAMVAAKGAGRILAGGTDLLVQLRAGFVKPGSIIVDIKKIAEMTAIEDKGGGSFKVGAAVTGMQLHDHATFGKAWPGVLEAINLIGSKQIQGRASAGGNLCNASPAADSVPALVAAGAMVTVQGPKGRREVPVEKIPAGPGRMTLEPGEIVVGFTLPARPAGSSDAYLRLIPRTEMDIAVVGLGVSLTMKDGTCTAARVGLGAVAPTVLLVEAAPPRRWSAPSSTPRRWSQRPPPAAPSASRSTTSAAPSSIAPRSPACFSSAPPPSPPHAPRKTEREQRSWLNFTSPPPSTASRPSSCASRRRPCSTCLRDQLGLTGTKEGCGSGDCGACSVMVDGSMVCSCLVLAAEAEGKKIETIEGMAKGDQLHALQQKFIEFAALQCGICTPGFLVASRALLERNNNPTETEVRYWLAGNLCRCTGYDKIVRAVMEVAADMRGATRREQAEVQVDRHASGPSRRRRQGDGPRPFRRRLQHARPADRQGAAQPACPCPDQIDRHLGRREAAGRKSRGDVEGLPRAAQPDRPHRRDAGQPARHHAQRHGAREGAL